MIINFRDLGSSGGGSDPRLTSSAFTSVDYVSSAKTIYFKNLNGSVVGSIDATDFVVDGMVQDVYISGNTLVIEFNTESGKQDINVDLSDIFDPDNYWTSAQTQSAITAATDDMATQTWVGQQNYLTAYTETDPVFTGSPAYGITSQNINDWNSKLDASALTPYYTSAQTQSAITEAFASAKTYTDTQISGATSGISSKLDTVVFESSDLAVSQALNELNNVKVTSNDVRNIVKMTQAQYDALSGNTSSTTLYVIINS